MMRRIAAPMAVALALCAQAYAGTVRPAPNFALDGAKTKTLRGFHGQPVVLVITASSRVKDFKKQVNRLKEMYGQLATEKVVFVAAIANGDAKVPSDIPFALAENPAQVAADYGVTGKFAIAVIGIDGNLDMITTKVINAERIRDVVYNNYETQTAERKPLSQ
jgi:hypothetical protein